MDVIVRVVRAWMLACCVCTCVLAQGWAACPAADVAPAEPPREFRGLWVASVANIDWPSSRTLSAKDQRVEIDRIIARAAELRFNTIVLQVRPSCDAMYASTLEPWSEFLAGESGKAPDDGYDPLKVWVEKCHAAGLELHAWINPFRVRHFESKKADAATHISKTHPELVKAYDQYLWLDPGEQASQDHTMKVVLDIVTRYDIDGLHIDDYFYPYPKAGSEFPDDASYARFKAGGGTLARGEWRRQNIDRFVERLYREVHAARKYVKVGISPFGIWRPDNPTGVKGLDAYDKLFADARKWLADGWLDYCSPQLYWKLDAPQQPFAPLLDWWIAHNTKGRHLWPGIYASRTLPAEKQRWDASEIVKQIQLRRGRKGATGEVHFSAAAYLAPSSTLAPQVAGLYTQRACVPASPWLGQGKPSTPDLVTHGDASTLILTPRTASTGWRWVVGIKAAGGWSYPSFPLGLAGGINLGKLPEGTQAVCVWSMDRAGVLSDPAAFRWTP